MEELTKAWSEAVFAQLPQGGKSIFSTGRFLESSDGAAVFALDNVFARDHCEKHRPAAEAALSAHFGRPVPLRLVALAEAPPRASRGATSGPRRASSAAPVPEVEEEIVDVHALEDAPDAASGVERLAEAFPGAELVEEP